MQNKKIKPLKIIILIALLIQIININKTFPEQTKDKLSVEYLFSFDAKRGELEKTTGKPRTIAINSFENIFVLIPYAKEVRVYNLNGKYLYSFGKKMEKNKDEKGSFSEPSGITIDNEDLVYITDLVRDVVLVFSPKGEFIHEFPIFQPVDKPDACAPFISFNEHKKLLYIPDPCTQSINVYKLSGEFVTFFGEIGTDLGSFGGPANCTFSKDGEIYIVDSGNFRIQSFNSNHNPKLFFGKMGVNNGEFVRPYGITIDEQGRIYVSDVVLKSIQIFNQEGNFFATIKDEEIIKQPLGIICSKHNRLYIADGEALKIHVFKIE